MVPTPGWRTFEIVPKNIQFPYGAYSAHYCLGIIYDRSDNAEPERSGPHSLDELYSITSVISNFRFFIAEKWKIAGDKPGSGNTANIGSIQRIADILSGNGMFAHLGEEWFDDYWMNFGKITVKTESGDTKRVTTLEDFVKYRGGDVSLDSSKEQSTMSGSRPVVPPIKCQGIKTKLVSWIGAVKPPTFNGTWIEPFMGSGVVAFSIRPNRALLADSNPHLINFYRAIAEGKITSSSTRRFLEIEGGELLRSNGEHYYKVRERFNRQGDPLDFLFLNRAGFNGLIRFNRKGGYNVPFCRKPNRFAQAYITKIANQVQAVIDVVSFGNYEFVCQDFTDTIGSSEAGDLIYCDPPYIDRHADYFNQWNVELEHKLARSLSTAPCSFILSVWHSNDFRKNTFLDSLWSDFHVCTRQHFYHVGGKEDNRNQMTEALVTNFAPELKELPKETSAQLALLETAAPYLSDRSDRVFADGNPHQPRSSLG